MAKNRNQQIWEMIQLLEDCMNHIEKHSVGSLKDAELVRKIEDKINELHIERRRLQKCDQ